MHIELLVEDRSTEVALANLLPRILPAATWRIHPFRGRSDLLGHLPQRLKGYRSWMPSDWRLVVLIDEDRRGCVELKARLEDIARVSDFTTKSMAAGGGEFNVLNRLAIEELEAVRHGSDGCRRVRVPPEHEPVGSVARGAIIWSNPI